jgi:predicted permease
MFQPEEETETAMLNTVTGAFLPMVVTFLLGFVAAWRHDFGSMEASTPNRMVLLYALPLTLFAGTVTTSRAGLSQDIPLVIALCVACWTSVPVSQAWNLQPDTTVPPTTSLNKRHWEK